MQAVIFIKSTDVQERKSGEFTFRTQTGYLREGEASIPLEIPVPRGGVPYGAGSYGLDFATFDRDKYGRLSIGSRGLVLCPLK